MSNIVPSGDQNYEHCYKCCLQLTPEMRHRAHDGYCPRCCHDLTIVDICELPVTPEQLKDKQSQKEMYDLVQMVQNWAKFHKDYVATNGVDWSAPHELVEIIGMQMMPWIARLVQTGHFTKEHVAQISVVIDREVEELVVQLEAEEDILRLTGQWSDREQEIKDYWKKEMGGFQRVSMRDKQRQLSDQ